MRRNTNAPHEVEQLVFYRSRMHCEICGNFLSGVRGMAWSLQHRLPRGMGGTRRPEVSAASNLIAVCGNGTTGCHGHLEAHRLLAYDQGRAIRHGRDVNPAEVPVQLIHGHVLLADDGTWTEVPT